MDFAVSSSNALVRAASSVGRPRILIVSDINMSGMTGLEMLPKNEGNAD
jgi:CheY-like chemotaxis protein